MRMVISAVASAAALRERGRPVVTDDTVETNMDTPVSIAVLFNDTSPVDQELMVLSATADNPAELTSVVIEPNYALTITPAVGFTGVSTVTYVAADQNNRQRIGTLTVNVVPEPQPFANPDSAVTDSNTPILVDVLANDTHPAGDVLTVVGAVVSVGYGSAAVESNQVRYYPQPYWSGNATLTYTIEDENGDQDQSTLQVTVNDTFGGSVPATWPDPYDEPTGTVLHSWWIDGSVTGSGKTGCDFTTNQEGLEGPTDASRWASTIAGRGVVNLRQFVDSYTPAEMIVRLRAKVVTNGTAKTWLRFENEFMDVSFAVSMDISNDGTAPASRVGTVSGPVSDVSVMDDYRYPGWMFIKFRLNLTGVVDTNGGIHVFMADNDHGVGDGLIDGTNPTTIHVQDLTYEEVV